MCRIALPRIRIFVYEMRLDVIMAQVCLCHRHDQQDRLFNTNFHSCTIFRRSQSNSAINYHHYYLLETPRQRCRKLKCVYIEFEPKMRHKTQHNNGAGMQVHLLRLFPSCKFVAPLCKYLTTECGCVQLNVSLSVQRCKVQPINSIVSRRSLLRLNLICTFSVCPETFPVRNFSPPFTNANVNL